MKLETLTMRTEELPMHQIRRVMPVCLIASWAVLALAGLAFADTAEWGAIRESSLPVVEH
jgi:hypothetical protein